MAQQWRIGVSSSSSSSSSMCCSINADGAVTVTPTRPDVLRTQGSVVLHLLTAIACEQCERAASGWQAKLSQAVILVRLMHPFIYAITLCI